MRTVPVAPGTSPRHCSLPFSAERGQRCGGRHDARRHRVVCDLAGREPRARSEVMRSACQPGRDEVAAVLAVAVGSSLLHPGGPCHRSRTRPLSRSRHLASRARLDAVRKHRLPVKCRTDARSRRVRRRTRTRRERKKPHGRQDDSERARQHDTHRHTIIAASVTNRGIAIRFRALVYSDPARPIGCGGRWQAPRASSFGRSCELLVILGCGSGLPTRPKSESPSFVEVIVSTAEVLQLRWFVRVDAAPIVRAGKCGSRPLRCSPNPARCQARPRLVLRGEMGRLPFLGDGLGALPVEREVLARAAVPLPLEAEAVGPVGRRRSPGRDLAGPDLGAGRVVELDPWPGVSSDRSAPRPAPSPCPEPRPPSRRGRPRSRT